MNFLLWQRLEPLTENEVYAPFVALSRMNFTKLFAVYSWSLLCKITRRPAAFRRSAFPVGSS